MINNWIIYSIFASNFFQSYFFTRMASKSKTRFLMNALLPLRWLLVGRFIFASTWPLSITVEPYIVKLIINNIEASTGGSIFSILLIPLALFLGWEVVKNLGYRLHDIVSLLIKVRIKKGLTEKLMFRMLDHSHSLYQDNLAGGLANRIKDVRYGTPKLIEIFVDQFWGAFIATAIGMITLWQLHIGFAMALIVWCLVFVFISQKMGRKGKKLSEDNAEAKTHLVGNIVDTLINMMNVRLFAGKKQETKKLYHLLDNTVEAESKQGWFFIRIFTLQGVSFTIYQICCFFALMYGYKEGFITTGDFALVLYINLGIMDSLWMATEKVMEFAENAGNVSQGLKIALSPLEITDQPDATELKFDKGAIEFKEVSFKYQEEGQLFKKQSIAIQPGQKVGLVGYSGGGKSTFVNLILRLFDLDAGQILIDGQDIKTVTQTSLHQAIGMIPQDPTLFHRSLLENIRYGKATATNEEVIAAAQKAHANEFIEALPSRYDTLVGERGFKISGGQRQRIAIARAILKNAPILILDEATSQLDSLTESAIQESLWELIKNKTTLIIAHRLSTLQQMDRILVFDQGSIVQDGNHTTLMAQPGLYQQLWNEQVGGFLLEKQPDNPIQS